MRPSKGETIAITAVAVAAIASTPLYWLLGGPDTGELVAASVQGATGIAALAWALLTSPAAAEPGAADTTHVVSGTGEASAEDGGTAVSGALSRSGDVAGSVRVEKSGAATGKGPESVACTGVVRG